MIDIRPEIAQALISGAPLVALESTLISHGLPWPDNLETAREAQATVRVAGATPATIAVWRGRPTIGLSDEELVSLATDKGVLKASRRDLCVAVARGCTASTTVAATIFLAHQAGIRFLATGGIGGVHRGSEKTGDVSADLMELGRTPVAVICAGAKIVLDLPKTLEVLESLGVPVIGFCTDEFPAFYVRSSRLPVSARVDSVEDAGVVLTAHWDLGGAGIILAQPIEEKFAIEPGEIEHFLRLGEQEAGGQAIRGPALTPFLLSYLARATSNRALPANRALIVANARLAAQVACAASRSERLGNL